jgi:alkylation response protein AidB-like acyl-CoA dehydrogenase
VSNRVGDENDGWRVTMVTLSFERGTAFVSDVVNSMVMLHDVAEHARKSGAWDDTGLRREIGHLSAELDGLWALIKQGVSEATRSGVPGPGASVFKLRYSEVRLRLGDLAMRLLGRGGLAMTDLDGPGSGFLVEDWLNSRSYTIAAGTSQIQRNIVAERILGLPKEPKAG